MERVSRCNNSDFNANGAYVLYWMTAYRRTHFNFALERAVFWATELRRPLVIFEPLSCTYRWASERLHQFVIDGMHEKLVSLKNSPITYVPYVEAFPGEGRIIFSKIANRACLIVTDDFPAFEIPRWISKVASRSRMLVEKVDSNGLFPMRSTERIFLTAASFRRYFGLDTTKTDDHRPPLNLAMPKSDPLAGIDLPKFRGLDLGHLELAIPYSVDRSVAPVTALKGGTLAARGRLRTFVSTDAP